MIWLVQGQESGVKQCVKQSADAKKERNAVAILFKFQWFFRHKMYLKKNVKVCEKSSTLA